MKIGSIVARVLALPQATDFTQQVASRADVKLAVDVGCGEDSLLRRYRPKLLTLGCDVSDEAIAESRLRNAHDQYLLADATDGGFPDLVLKTIGGEVDLVTMYGVIEHLPKSVGYQIIAQCERITSKFVIIETPNGFVEQGPEFGNAAQRHLSGWFPHDFEGLGYKVYGTTGMKFFLGYAAGPRWNVRGIGTLNAIAAWLLRVDRHPTRAFNLLAIKDVRGVASRLG